MKLFYPSFIEAYDNQLSKQQCEQLIDFFESSPVKKPGLSVWDHRPVVNDDLKKCLELGVTRFNNHSFADDIISKVVNDCLIRYRKKYEKVQFLTRIAVDNDYNVQKYVDETDGFKTWHIEQGTIDPMTKRVLVWMIYLNDAKSGTDFLHYGRINAKRGRVVIWPSGYSHAHRSQLPNKGLKYIATGWISFV